MKIKMLDNLATVTECYTKGTEYDLPDAEARNLIEVGLATDPTGEVTPFKKPTRQTMDARTGVPAEEIQPPVNQLSGTGDAGKNQTAATVEAAATAAKTPGQGVNAIANHTPAIMVPPTTVATETTTSPGTSRGATVVKPAGSVTPKSAR